MLRIRGLLFATVVLAMLAGGVYWSNKTKEAEAKKPAADEAPKLLTIPEDQIERVEIRKAGADATVLDRKSGKWELTSPQPLPADQGATGSLVSTLSSLSADRLVEEKTADLAQYGLAKPTIELVVTKRDGKSQEVLIGDETPTSGGYFAKLASDPRVFTIPGYTKTGLDKTSKDLRDKRLLTFDSGKLTRVELSAKGRDFEFGKNNQNEWQIVKPRPLRADGGQVDDLIRRLADARMDLNSTDEESKKAAAAFASGAQVAIAKVTDAAGTQELTVRKDKDKNYYAKSSVVEGIYKVASDLGDGLDKSLDDFRNKKVFDFGWSEPDKIEVREGAKQVDYQKSGGKWWCAGKEMDSATIETVVDKLRDLSATKFPEKGFTAPVLDFTVTSNDGKRVEKAAIAKSGNDYLAKRENEPALYLLDAKVVEELQKALANVKQAAPQPAAKKK